MSNTAAPYYSKTPQYLIMPLDAGPPGSGDALAVKATGTVTFTTAAAADGDDVVVIDALGNTVNFEFDNNATITPGNVAVAPGADEIASAANLAAAINAHFLRVSATHDGAGVVTLTQEIAGTSGNTTITETGTNIAAVSFTGGLDVRAGIVDKTTSAGPLVGGVPTNIYANGTVCGVIENDGDQALVFTVQHSAANTAAQYAANAVTFRVNGSNVTTVTVQPRGQVVFTIETWDALSRYVRFSVGRPSGGNLLEAMAGTLTVVYFRGSLRQVQREAA